MPHLIPKRVRLPFWHVVAIKQVPFEEILCHATEEGACWVVETQTILIDQDLTLPEKRYWMLTQLHHALLDVIHEDLDAGILQPPSAS